MEAYQIWFLCFFGIIGICFIIAIIEPFITPKKNKRNADKIYNLAQELSEVCSFNQYDNTLTLYKQDKRILKLVSVSPYTAVYEEYGVLTRQRTDRYELKIKSYDYQTESVKVYPIEKIRLQGKNLMAKAKQHDVSKYLENNHIIIKEKYIVPRESASLMSIGLTEKATKEYTLNNIDKYPTMEKCREIIGWLSSSE